MDCEEVFKKLVKGTEDYCIYNGIKSLVLGISGGIDSTVVAAIAREVCDRNPEIKFISASLPIKNEAAEYDVSVKVGEAFSPEGFERGNLLGIYNTISSTLMDNKIKRIDKGKVLNSNNILRTPISEGNIQARLRMIYLYDLASITNGMVLSTDNQTEYQLGFWTIHGDVGDFDPIQALWKTEVYEIAEWLVENYNNKIANLNTNHQDNDQLRNLESRVEALKESIALTPTDGLGISESDLKQIGAKSYKDVDDILNTLLNRSKIVVMGDCLDVSNTNLHILYKKYGNDVVDAVWLRHARSGFKRMKSPISIPRKDLF